MKGAFELIVIQATLKGIKLACCPSEPIRGVSVYVRHCCACEAKKRNVIATYIPSAFPQIADSTSSNTEGLEAHLF